MEITVSISDEKLQNLSTSANAEIQKVAEHYIEEVLDEASRIEESRRTSTSNPEITAAIINDGAHFAKTQGIRTRKSGWSKCLQFLSFLASVFTGGLFNLDKLSQPTYCIIFLTVLVFAAVSTFYLIFIDNSNG